MRHYTWPLRGKIEQENSQKDENFFIWALKLPAVLRMEVAFFGCLLSLWRYHTRQFGVPAEV
jgi:hypothetical protein